MHKERNTDCAIRDHTLSKSPTVWCHVSQEWCPWHPLRCEWVDIALRCFLHNHHIIATEGSPKPGLCPSLIEWLQRFFIVHSTIDSTADARPLYSLVSVWLCGHIVVCFCASLDLNIEGLQFEILYLSIAQHQTIFLHFEVWIADKNKVIISWIH